MGELVSRVPSKLLQRIWEDEQYPPDTDTPTTQYNFETKGGHAKQSDVPKRYGNNRAPTWVWWEITLHRTARSKDDYKLRKLLQHPDKVFAPIRHGVQHLNPVDISNYA